jgi:hypothetical protein
MFVTWLSVAALVLGAGARIDGLAGIESAPLRGPWALFGNPAALGLFSSSWSTVGDFGSLDLHRYAVVQSNPTSRGPVGLLLETGSAGDRWEVAFVLPDQLDLAYGFDINYYAEPIEGFSFDLNLAAQYGSGMAFGLTWDDVAKQSDDPSHLRVGLSYLDPTGGLLLLEADGFDGWSAEVLRLAVGIEESGFEYRAGVVARPGGRDWSLGMGTGPSQRFLADYAWSNGRSGVQHRFAIGVRYN